MLSVESERTTGTRCSAAQFLLRTMASPMPRLSARFFAAYANSAGKAVSAGKWRVWPAGSLESSTSLPSARMRTRVALDVETERSSAVEFAWGGSSAGREAACAAPSDWVVTAEEGLPLRRAEYRRQP